MLNSKIFNKGGYKMKEKYVPQFDSDNIPEQEHKIKTCKKCGKTGAYVGLDNIGICFDCRNSKNIVMKNIENYPNKELFKKWYFSQPKNKFAEGPMWIIPYRILLYLYRLIFPNDKVSNQFEFYNSISVYVTENGWRCPCCGFDNIGNTHCERCGVLPKLIEKTNDSK